MQGQFVSGEERLCAEHGAKDNVQHGFAQQKVDQERSQS